MRPKRILSMTPCFHFSIRAALLAAFVGIAGMRGSLACAQEAGAPQLPASPADSGTETGLPDVPSPAQASPEQTSSEQTSSELGKSNTQTDKDTCSNKLLPCPKPLINWYMRFENGPQVKPLTPREKGWLATKNVIDPFNVITILGISGISVAADSHSAYGPGMPGYGRYVGVSFTQDIMGEFFGTFLIPSVVHQDPHYHRMPHASYLRRALHTVDAVAWARGDNGKGMLNYSTLVGYGIDDEIANLYVPGRQTNGSATAQRYFTGLATTPIDNAISEFLPDVARRIHVQIVLVQRIINQVANKDSGGS